MVIAVFYIGVMKHLLVRIRRVRPEYRVKGSWRLLHDNAPAHRSTLITDFFTINGILTINHSPCSPYLAPCNFYLFRKLYLAMKGKFWCLSICFFEWNKSTLSKLFLFFLIFSLCENFRDRLCILRDYTGKHKF